VNKKFMGQASCKAGGCSDSVSGEEVAIIESTRVPAPGLSNGLPQLGASGSASDISYWKKKTFDYDQNTEDAFAVPHFTGKFQDIRPLLDYTYHKKFNEERVMLQDRLIEDLLVGGEEQEDLLLPWVIFTAGAMGAGKGFVIRWMNKQKCLPLEQFILVDPDQIRQMLPEWDGYVERDPMTAAVKTQKEAGHIAEILGYRALRHRRNVIFDGSLRDVEWYKLYFEKLRQQFPGIRLMILHIQAERDAVLQRAEARGRETGRMVPRELLESSMDAVPRSVEKLAPFVDVACRVLNVSNQDPQFQREPTAINPPNGVPITREYFSKLWSRIDTDGDGELSRCEVSVALAQGIITKAVLDTIDTNHDGAISKEELQNAVTKAYSAGSKTYRN
jgi:hypothetical protein